MKHQEITCIEMNLGTSENGSSKTENRESLFRGDQEITKNLYLTSELIVKNEPNETVDKRNPMHENQDYLLSPNRSAEATIGNECIKTEDSEKEHLGDTEVSPVFACTTGRLVTEGEAQETKNHEAISSNCQNIIPIFSDEVQSSGVGESENQISPPLFDERSEEKTHLSNLSKFPINDSVSVFCPSAFDKEFNVTKSCDILTHSQLHSNYEEEFRNRTPIAAKKWRHRTKVVERKNLSEDRVSKKKFAENSGIVEIILDEEESTPEEKAPKGDQNEKDFTCAHCDRQFKKKCNLVTHLRFHSRLCSSTNVEERVSIFEDETIPRNNYRYGTKNVGRNRNKIEVTCDICGKVLKAKRYLKRHLKLHQTVPLLACKFCAMTFSCRFDLQEHSQSHIGSEAVVESKHNISLDEMMSLLEEAKSLKSKKGVDFLSCSVCQKQFTRLGNLRTHLNGHLKILKYKCKHCEKIFSSLAGLRRHISSHFDVPKKHECPQCHKTFSINYLLERHLSSHNKNLCGFMCDKCDFRGYSVHDLAHHKRVHSGKFMACGQCSTTFYHKSDLEKHKKIHTETKDWVCEICDMKFCRFDYLKRHRKVHDSSEFFCKFCGANYSNSRAYGKHLRVHKKSDPLKQSIEGAFPKALSIYV